MTAMTVGNEGNLNRSRIRLLLAPSSVRHRAVRFPGHTLESLADDKACGSLAMCSALYNVREIPKGIFSYRRNHLRRNRRKISIQQKWQRYTPSRYPHHVSSLSSQFNHKWSTFECTIQETTFMNWTILSSHLNTQMRNILQSFHSTDPFSSPIEAWQSFISLWNQGITRKFLQLFHHDLEIIGREGLDLSKGIFRSLVEGIA